jgi:hypothetical protein
MRWKTAGLCALALIGTLGCPHAFGRGGTIDRAASKDLKAQLGTARCDEQQLETFCGVGADWELCIEECG